MSEELNKMRFPLVVRENQRGFLRKIILQQQPTCCSGVSPCIACGTPPFRLNNKRTEIRYIFSIIRRTKHKILTKKIKGILNHHYIDWREEIAYMKTKKALAGLLGLFGSFPAFSFTGFLLPLSFAFLLTDNLQNPNQNVTFPNFSQTEDESRHHNQAIKTKIPKRGRKPSDPMNQSQNQHKKTLQKDRKPTHLLSAFFVVSAFDFDPFISKPVGEKLRSVKIEAKTADQRIRSASNDRK